MKSPDLHLYDLFDGDPDISYHQDYRDGIQPSPIQTGFILPIIIFLLTIIYQVLVNFNCERAPLTQLLGNVIVFLKPSSLLNVFDRFQNLLRLRIRKKVFSRNPRNNSAGSDTMRRILSLDTHGGLIGSVAQAGRRRLSSINMVAQKLDESPAGLGNWDNSCYQNSVLQGLASLKTLSAYLTSLTNEIGLVENGEIKIDIKMTEALRGLIETLNNPSNNGKRVWTPATLKNMSSWQQQDAQEYFSKVLDEIDKEMGTAVNLTEISPAFESDCSKTTKLETSRLKKLRNPLEGLIAQRVGCIQCGHSEGLSLIPFNCLTVPLGRFKGYDISQCLDEYTKLELIEGVECRKCTLIKSHSVLSALTARLTVVAEDSPTQQPTEERLAAITEALENDDYEDVTLLKKCKIAPKNWVTSTKSRQAVIARPPNSLVVHFNRSLYDEVTGELKKNCSPVKFPRYLDIGPWCLGSAVSAESISTEEWILNPDKSLIASSKIPSRQSGPCYELRAVLTHYGRHENGHYVCYKKHPIADIEGKCQQDQWWRLSDDEVMKVSEDNVLGQGGVFMLFYDCVQPATPLFPGAPTGYPDEVEKYSAATMYLVPHEVLAMDSRHDSCNMTTAENLSLAANVPLPHIEDDDLSESEYQESILSLHERSVTSNISEPGEEEQFESKPLAIHGAPYFPWKADEIKGEDTEVTEIDISLSRSLLMT